MANWLIVNDNVIVDAVVADTMEYVEELFLSQVLEDDGIKGIGWTLTQDGWRAPYPAGGIQYTWDSELNAWVPESPTMPEDTFIVEE
jgi:hypothetical protein